MMYNTIVITNELHAIMYDNFREFDFSDIDYIENEIVNPIIREWEKEEDCNYISEFAVNWIMKNMDAIVAKHENQSIMCP